MRIWILLLVFMLVLGTTQAQQVSYYRVFMDAESGTTITELIRIELNNTLNLSTLDYEVDGIPKNVRVSDQNGPLSFSVQEGSTSLLSINLRSDTAVIDIEFQTSSLIFSTDNQLLFFTDFSTDLTAEHFVMQFSLPEGYGVVQDSVRPGATVGTDGRRINLIWSFDNFSGTTSFAAKFERLQNNTSLVPVAFGFVVLMIAIVLYYRRRVEEHFIKGFSEDEKKVIEYIKNHDTAYQNKIEHEFKFSRAKMTRIVAKLESKNLVEKKRKGRTNRLTWKR